MSEIEESDSHDENSESDHDDGLRRETFVKNVWTWRASAVYSFRKLKRSVKKTVN